MKCFMQHNDDLNCVARTASLEECQAVCDATLYCDAWTWCFNKEGTNFENCKLKMDQGWETKDSDTHHSGFTGQGPNYAPYVKINGGNYDCR